MMTFRQFIETGLDGGQPTNPDNDQNNQSSHDDLGVLGRELNIEPKNLRKALEKVPILSYSPINQPGQDKDSGPQVILPDKMNKSGSVDGRIMAGNLQKRRNPNGSLSHGSQTERPIHFRSTNNKNASYTFPNVWLEPLRQQQKQMGGGAGMGMGGGAGVPPPPGGI